MNLDHLGFGALESIGFPTLLFIITYIYIYITDCQASSSSTLGFPSTVPFSLYEQMVIMVDRLEGENANLRCRVDQLYRENFDNEPNRPPTDSET